jgi:hypothetical protein
MNSHFTFDYKIYDPIGNLTALVTTKTPQILVVMQTVVIVWYTAGKTERNIPMQCPQCASEQICDLKHILAVLARICFQFQEVLRSFGQPLSALFQPFQSLKLSKLI